MIAFAALALPQVGLGQQKKAANGVPPGIPFFDGQSFFDQFFNPGGEKEREQLATVEVSMREEQEYGERVLQAFQDDFKRRKIAISTKGREVDYLRKLVDSLRTSMTNRQRYPSIRVLVADTDITDAYSIPGGTLVVFRGMIELADSEAALAGVVGHELSHLDRGHQLVPVKRNKLLKQNPKSTDGDPWAMFRQANLFMSAFLKPFRPEDELEADRDGATWAYRAGYDPRAMMVLFSKLNDRDQIGRFAPAFLRSHPYHADRGAQVEQLYAELQDREPRSDLYIGRTNLRRLIPKSERRFPE
jgi:predicted Zn-dependent protease